MRRRSGSQRGKEDELRRHLSLGLTALTRQTSSPYGTISARPIGLVTRDIHASSGV